MSDAAPPPVRRVRWYALVVPQVAALAASLLAALGLMVWQAMHWGLVRADLLVGLIRTDFLANNLLLDASNLVLLGLSLWFLSRITDPALPSRLLPLTRKAAFIGLAAGAGTVLASGLFEYLCDHFLHTDIGRDAGRLVLMPHRADQILLGTFTAVLLAPLAEEVYFRGLLLGWFKRHWGTWPAIAASALLFGVLHLKFLTPGLDGWLITIELVVMGLVLGVVAVRTGSLWASFLAHALNNLCALLAVLAAGQAAAGTSGLSWN